MTIALRRKSVNKSGAALGILFSFILSIANHAFFASLAAFFFTSSRATKFRAHLKRKFEKDFKEGEYRFHLKNLSNHIWNLLYAGEGQRNWVQVLSNGGMATQLALLYLIDCGSCERPIDFTNEYRSSWLSVAVMSE